MPTPSYSGLTSTPGPPIPRLRLQSVRPEQDCPSKNLADLMRSGDTQLRRACAETEGVRALSRCRYLQPVLGNHAGAHITLIAKRSISARS